MNALKILDFFRNSAEKAAALKLYQHIVSHSRTPGFYLDYGVPDTVDGRFDMIALHTILVLHRLKQHPGQTSKLSQELFDILFADMDQNLREMGVGDLSVGKKIKKMTAAFQGRLISYEKSLNSIQELEAALSRNLYRHVEPKPEQLNQMAQSIIEQVEALNEQRIDAMIDGEITFKSTSFSSNMAS